MKQFGLKYPPMVKSFLDTDQYKFSMQQCYLHQFNSASAEWDFKARNVTDYTAEDRAEISRQLDAYCALTFTDEELKYLASKLWVKPDYISTIRYWKPHREEIEVTNRGKVVFYITPERLKLMRDLESLFGCLPREAYYDKDIDRE